ncbi:MAG: hypothetical protein ACJ768_24565 [Gaiellaceae bacterium]|jgi:hypothetical protein
MSTRTVAGAFLLGLAAGVVLSEVVARAARPAGESAAPVAVPDAEDLSRYAPWPLPAGGWPAFVPIPGGGAGPVPAAESWPVPLREAGPVAEDWPAVSAGRPGITPGETGDGWPVPARSCVPPRRDRRERPRRRPGGVSRLARQIRQLGQGALFAAGLAVALGLAAFRRRRAALPAELRYVPAVAGPVEDFGRVLPGRALAVAVRCNPRRGPDSRPVRWPALLAATPGMVPV